MLNIFTFSTETRRFCLTEIVTGLILNMRQRRTRVFCAQICESAQLTESHTLLGVVSNDQQRRRGQLGFFELERR
jgi:hypothetical protein